MCKKYVCFSKNILGLASAVALGLSGYSLQAHSSENDRDHNYGYENVHEQQYHKQDTLNRATPLGYNKYIIIMGNGSYNSPDGTRFLNGLEGGDGIAFQHKVMGRSDAEIARLEQQAKSFFAQKFGLYAGSDDRITFTGFQIDPRNNVRAYSVSDEDTPLSGWEVASGGWQMTVVDPEGLTLGGEFAGRAIHVDPGTFFVFGDHKIIRSEEEDEGENEDAIVIRFKTGNPYEMPKNGGLVLMDLESDEWGKGSIGGSIVNAVSDDGLLQSRLRSVITFPPLPNVN